MSTEETEPAALPEPVEAPCDTAAVVDFEWTPYVRHVSEWRVTPTGDSTLVSLCLICTVMAAMYQRVRCGLTLVCTVVFMVAEMLENLHMGGEGTDRHQGAVDAKHFRKFLGPGIVFVVVLKQQLSEVQRFEKR